MILLSHRGYWKDITEKNEPIAFERSFDLGFGTETDVRDVCGKIVISHDMPKGNELSFDELLSIMDGRNLPLALNIKADGLCNKLKETLEKYNHTNYFCFDMSIPEMVFQINHNMAIFTGMSDVLPTPVLLDKATGVWLDCFKTTWYDATTIDHLLELGKKVCVVSADLHKRETTQQWAILQECKHIKSDNLMLCTDYLEQAKEYFQK